jgi:hypothetical protein
VYNDTLNTITECVSKCSITAKSPSVARSASATIAPGLRTNVSAVPSVYEAKKREQRMAGRYWVAEGRPPVEGADVDLRVGRKWASR